MGGGPLDRGEGVTPMRWRCECGALNIGELETACSVCAVFHPSVRERLLPAPPPSLREREEYYREQAPGALDVALSPSRTLYHPAADLARCTCGALMRAGQTECLSCRIRAERRAGNFYVRGAA